MSIHEDVESESEENLVSEEELEAEDFERTPRPSGSVPDYVQELSSSPVRNAGGSNDCLGGQQWLGLQYGPLFDCNGGQAS